MRLLEQKRNLLPVLSIEGNKETSDTRRGEGVYDTLQSTMKALHKTGMI